MFTKNFFMVYCFKPFLQQQINQNDIIHLFLRSRLDDTFGTFKVKKNIFLNIFRTKILLENVFQIMLKWSRNETLAYSWFGRFFINSLNSYTYWKLVLITMGCPKKLGTLSSINECALIKFKVKSGNVRLSLWHWPGLGSGTFWLNTGNQFEFRAACSLKLPSNVSVMSWRLKAQTALPDMLFGGVVNVP